MFTFYLDESHDAILVWNYPLVTVNSDPEPVSFIHWKPTRVLGPWDQGWVKHRPHHLLTPSQARRRRHKDMEIVIKVRTWASTGNTESFLRIKVKINAMN